MPNVLDMVNEMYRLQKPVYKVKFISLLGIGVPILTSINARMQYKYCW